MHFAIVWHILVAKWSHSRLGELLWSLDAEDDHCDINKRIRQQIGQTAYVGYLLEIKSKSCKSNRNQYDPRSLNRRFSLRAYLFKDLKKEAVLRLWIKHPGLTHQIRHGRCGDAKQRWNVNRDCHDWHALHLEYFCNGGLATARAHLCNIADAT